MPAYSATGLVPALYRGDTQAVWTSTDTITAGSSSQQVALTSNQDSGLYSVSVEIVFSGAPGTFEIDLQTADTDADANYVTVPGFGAINTVNSSNVARVETGVKAKFARLHTTSLANSVTATARISR